jgi:hypothetical protein
LSPGVELRLANTCSDLIRSVPQHWNVLGNAVGAIGLNGIVLSRITISARSTGRCRYGRCQSESDAFDLRLLLQSQNVISHDVELLLTISLNNGSRLGSVKAEAISLQSCGCSVATAAGKKARSSMAICWRSRPMKSRMMLSTACRGMMRSASTVSIA